ncbi:MAG: thiamine diphosphokinase, partial [Clostridia bacterium]|nr:thiamine diphosphokinase [Clostridia bacterium]
MRALIIGNGDIKNYDNVMRKIGKTDLIICADGGYNHAKKMGITPDVLIGDLDSAIGYENIKNRVEYPTRKDFTDGELAVMYAEEHGCDSVV